MTVVIVPPARKERMYSTSAPFPGPTAHTASPNAAQRRVAIAERSGGASPGVAAGPDERVAGAASVDGKR
jgi:hypothetical protein